MLGAGVRVLVVGAGIAGLAAARTLRDWGAAIEIVERQPDPPGEGTRIYLLGNPVLAPTPTSTSTSSETSTPGQGTPNFKEKYTYDDGVAVEVTEIKTGRLTRQEAADAYDKEIKAGMPYAVFTIRVKNDSRERLSLGGEGIASYGSVTYGPDGEKARDLYSLGDIEGVSGTILPGTKDWALRLRDSR